MSQSLFPVGKLEIFAVGSLRNHNEGLVMEKFFSREVVYVTGTHHNGVEFFVLLLLLPNKNLSCGI
jgi:hypothetical protein